MAFVLHYNSSKMIALPALAVLWMLAVCKQQVQYA
jgi:hypothetical protein